MRYFVAVRAKAIVMRIETSVGDVAPWLWWLETELVRF